MSAPESTFYVTGGTLRHDAPSYVERQADKDLYDGLLNGEFCYVLTSRQMGKSSLMVRTTQRLRAHGMAVAVLDFTAIGQNVTPDQWYDGLIFKLGQQLDLEDELFEFWQRYENWGPLQRWTTSLEKVVLPVLKQRAAGSPAAQRLVLFVDEIDAVRSLPFPTDEFFAAIRECYNRRTYDSEFHRITFCLIGVATPSELIHDPRTTPFNIGRRIELNDFTPEEAAPLALGLVGRTGFHAGAERADNAHVVSPEAAALLDRILYWTHGHPYLTQRLCRAAVEANASRPSSHVPRITHQVIDQFCEQLFLSSRASGRDDNLLFVRERLLRSGGDLVDLLDHYEAIRSRQTVGDNETNPLINSLLLSGIVRVEHGSLYVRNRIYYHVFDHNWVKANRPAAPDEELKSIAVLPFINMSPDADNEYLSDGITEDLITALSQVKGLRVPARTSAFAFKGKNEDIRRVGEQLNVTTVLEGSVRRAGNKIRITAQLINVADGYHLWSEKYDREMEDVFAIQDEISRAIVMALKVQLIGDAKAPLVKQPTPNMDAYQLYLKGRFFWNQRGPGIKKGMYYFELALLEDPNYALALTGLADSYTLLTFYGYLPSKEAFSKAKTAALKASALDETLAEAHCSLGFIRFFFDWDPLAAEEEFQRALELNPHYVQAYYWYSSCLLGLGRNDDAVAADKRALEIDPLSVFANTHLGWAFVVLRQYDLGIEQLQKTLELDPNFLIAHWLLGQAYVHQRMYAESFAEFQKAIEISGGNLWMVAWLGYAYGLAGEVNKANQVLSQLIECSKETYVRSFFMALVYIGLDNKDQAILALHKACDERDFWIQWLNIDAIFDGLRSDPRFPELLKKIGVRQPQQS